MTDRCEGRYFELSHWIRHISIHYVKRVEAKRVLSANNNVIQSPEYLVFLQYTIYGAIRKDFRERVR